MRKMTEPNFETEGKHSVKNNHENSVLIGVRPEVPHAGPFLWRTLFEEGGRHKKRSAQLIHYYGPSGRHRWCHNRIIFSMTGLSLDCNSCSIISLGPKFPSEKVIQRSLLHQCFNCRWYPNKRSEVLTAGSRLSWSSFDYIFYLYGCGVLTWTVVVIKEWAPVSRLHCNPYLILLDFSTHLKE